MSDHDLLIQLAEDMKWVKKTLGNHLHFHFWTNITLLSIIGGLVIALITALIVK